VDDVVHSGFEFHARRIHTPNILFNFSSPPDHASIDAMHDTRARVAHARGNNALRRNDSRYDSGASLYFIY